MRIKVQYLLMYSFDTLGGYHLNINTPEAGVCGDCNFAIGDEVWLKPPTPSCTKQWHSHIPYAGLPGDLPLVPSEEHGEEANAGRYAIQEDPVQPMPMQWLCRCVSGVAR
ncbi:hypothetical protein EB796_022580 [Bugula neritina]|uniref:Uncharacterized protein n=1 Tax=Bugula neritina TaxID=10212 RepID=A0A7J7IYU8_BUGNE|nr:hypothetical protein EB796_022580 [Bugula neritina]